MDKNVNLIVKDNYGFSVLHLAAQIDNLNYIKYLIEKRTELSEIINDGNKNNDTPLHIASLFGNKIIIKYLLSINANKNLKNNEDKTAFEVAQLEGYDKVESWFIN